MCKFWQFPTTGIPVVFSSGLPNHQVVSRKTHQVVSRKTTGTIGRTTKNWCPGKKPVVPEKKTVLSEKKPGSTDERAAKVLTSFKKKTGISSSCFISKNYRFFSFFLVCPLVLPVVPPEVTSLVRMRSSLMRSRRNQSENPQKCNVRMTCVVDAMQCSRIIN